MKPTILNPRAWPGDRLLDDLRLCMLLHEGGGPVACDPILRHQAPISTYSVPPVWTGGRAGAALFFDGAGGYLTTDAIGTFWNGTHRGQHTYAAWVMMNKTNAQNPVRLFGHLVLGRPAGHPAGFTWGLSQSSLRLRLHTNSSHIDSTNSLNLHEWYHICTVLSEKDNEVRHYINGVEEIVTFYNWAGDNGAQVSIGGDPSSGGRDFLQGHVSDAWLWARSLSADEVVEHMRRTYRPFERRPIRYWEVAGSWYYYENLTPLWCGR